jgi:hypothetical protein
MYLVFLRADYIDGWGWLKGDVPSLGVIWAWRRRPQADVISISANQGLPNPASFVVVEAEGSSRQKGKVLRVIVYDQTPPPPFIFGSAAMITMKAILCGFDVSIRDQTK